MGPPHHVHEYAQSTTKLNFKAWTGTREFGDRIETNSTSSCPSQEALSRRKAMGLPWKGKQRLLISATKNPSHLYSLFFLLLTACVLACLFGPTSGYSFGHIMLRAAPSVKSTHRNGGLALSSTLFATKPPLYKITQIMTMPQNRFAPFAKSASLQLHLSKENEEYFEPEQDSRNSRSSPEEEEFESVSYNRDYQSKQGWERKERYSAKNRPASVRARHKKGYSYDDVDADDYYEDEDGYDHYGYKPDGLRSEKRTASRSQVHSGDRGAARSTRKIFNNRAPLYGASVDRRVSRQRMRREKEYDGLDDENDPPGEFGDSLDRPEDSAADVRDNDMYPFDEFSRSGRIGYRPGGVPLPKSLLKQQQKDDRRRPERNCRTPRQGRRDRCGRRQGGDWVVGEVSTWFEDGMENSRGYNRDRTGRQRKRSRRSLDLTGFLDEIFRVDAEFLDSKAKMYEERISSEREPTRSSRRKNGTYKYVDEDDELPLVADYEFDDYEQDTKDRVPKPVVQSRPPRRHQSWEDRAEATNRVPPSGVKAWGAHGEILGGIDALTFAALEAMEEIANAKKVLEDRKSQVEEAEENIIRVKSEAATKKKWIDSMHNELYPGVIRDRLRRINVKTEDAVLLLRRARTMLSFALDRVEDLEDKHWALLNQYESERILVNRPANESEDKVSAAETSTKPEIEKGTETSSPLESGAVDPEGDTEAD